MWMATRSRLFLVMIMAFGYYIFRKPFIKYDNHITMNPIIILSTLAMLAGIELGNHATKLRAESKFHLDRGEFYCPDCGELLIDDTIEYRGEVIKVKKCSNHQDYIGVFPRMRHKTENNKIKNLLKTKN